MARMSTARKVLWALVILGLAASVYRFAFGLGRATNLSDNFPWGIWIGLDVMSGVALAAGGFVIALTVYVLNLKRYQPLLRPAVLTAFVGYILAATGILFDLGQPQRIWHPVIYWNLHSPLFEVAVCVMTYLTVLALEFSPVYFEGRGWARAFRVMKSLTIPLVVAGIILSTMHQSSLGSMMLIAAGRLHPLWYTALLPVLYFVSAVAAGLAMVSVESYLSSRAYDRGFETPLLRSLARGTWWVLLLYAVLRLGDLAVGGRLGHLWEGSLESTLFLAETAIGVVLPLILLVLPAIHTRLTRLVTVQALVLLGVGLNRLDTVLIGMARALGGSYFPSLVEVAVTLGLVSAGVLVYAWAVERLPVFAEHAPAAAD